MKSPQAVAGHHEVPETSREGVAALDSHDLYDILCLDSNGLPNCGNHVVQASLQKDIEHHVKHLRTRVSGRDERLLNAAIAEFMSNGKANMVKLEAGLSKSNPIFSKQCCRPQALEVSKPMKPTEAQTWKWQLNNARQEDLHLDPNSSERLRREVKLLRHYDFEDVKNMIPVAIEHRKAKRGKGIRKTEFLTMADIEYIIENLEAKATEVSSSLGQKRAIAFESTGNKRVRLRRSRSTSTAPAPEGAGDANDTTIVDKPSFEEGDGNDRQDHSLNEANQGPCLPDPIVIESDEDSSQPVGSPPLFYLNKEGLMMLTGNDWINDSVIHSFLKVLEPLLDPAVTRLVDPISVPAKGSHSFPLSSTVLIPVHINKDHWVVARIAQEHEEVDIYDSFPLRHHREEARGIIIDFMQKHKMGRGIAPKFSYTAPLLQENGQDCGVAAIMTIFELALDSPIDHRMDLSCCRRLLYEILEDPHVPREREREFQVKKHQVSELVRDTTQKQSISVAQWTQMLEGMLLWGTSVSRDLEEESGKLAEIKVSGWASEALNLIRKAKALAQSREDQHMEEICLRLKQAEGALERELGCLKQKEDIEKALALTKTLLGGSRTA